MIRRPIIACALALCTASISGASMPALAQQAQPGASSFITLGTMGGPVPDGNRSQPANVLVRGADAYLVDVGDGAVQQLAKAKIRVPQVKAAFLSHLHVDHTGGLAALLGLRNQTDIRDVITVYGPPGTRELVDGIIASMQPAARAGYGIPGQPWPAPAEAIKVVELADGQMVDLGGMKVRVAQNTHYDFAPGSAEDQRYKSFSYRFDLPERSIVYTGDTGPSAAVEKLAAGADLLVSEMIDVDATLAAVARNAPNMPEAARKKLAQHLTTHHLVPRDIGLLASRAKVKAVVVTHFAGGTPSPARLADYPKEIGATFKGPVTIANDLDRF